MSVSSFTKRKFKINEKLRGLISICRSQEIIFSANKNNHSKQTFLENDGDSSCDWNLSVAWNIYTKSNYGKWPKLQSSIVRTA